MKTIIGEKIKELNAAICQEITGRSLSIHGLCIEAKRGEETINVDENNDPVFFDDKSDIYMYHKRSNISFSEQRARGKKVTYKAEAICTIYCMTSLSNFYEVLISILSQFNHIDIKDLDFDQYKILRSETGLKDFDFSRNIFALKYSITYSTDKCDSICLS